MPDTWPCSNPSKHVDEITKIRRYNVYKTGKWSIYDMPPKGFQSVHENGRTFLRHSGTGEEKPTPSGRWDAVRALQQARKQKCPTLSTWKVGCVKYVQCEKVLHKKCEARIDGKLCKKWEEVCPTVLCFKEKFRCDECVENDRWFKK
jgi:hypothetical protein